jgi:hypothetical protein
VFLRPPKSRLSAQEHCAALVKIADDLHAIVYAYRDGHRVFLTHPYRFARAIKRHLAALDADAKQRRAASAARPASPPPTIPATKLIASASRRDGTILHANSGNL